MAPEHGCRMFLGTTYQNGGNNTPNYHKIYQRGIQYTKCHILTSFFARLSKIYPILDFWFENKPTGNPAGFLSNEFPNVTAFLLAQKIFLLSLKWSSFRAL
jgi:hypothetical protein